MVNFGASLADFFKFPELQRSSGDDEPPVAATSGDATGKHVDQMLTAVSI
jgi:hypothetical protein